MRQIDHPLHFAFDETQEQHDSGLPSRVQAIKQCLDYLQTEAADLDMKLLAHLISVAAEHAAEYAAKTTH